MIFATNYGTNHHILPRLTGHSCAVNATEVPLRVTSTFPKSATMPSKTNLLTNDRRVAVTQSQLQPCQELPRTKRLGNVVVGAHLQQSDFVIKVTSAIEIDAALRRKMDLLVLLPCINVVLFLVSGAY